MEKAITALVLEHSARKSAPSVQRFVESQTCRLTNVNSERLKELLGSFDPDWQHDLSAFLVDERKDAIDSIVSLRNTIAHGQSVGVTYNQVRRYYEQIQKVIDHVVDLCAPEE